MSSWRKVPWLPLAEAKGEMESLTHQVEAERDPRKRIKLARRLAFAGASLAENEAPTTVEELEQGIAALALARRSGAVTYDLNRSQAKLARRRLEALGCAEAEILAETKKTVLVETACLAAASDPNLDTIFLTWENDEILRAMNQGRLFLARFGADGRYRVVLRWIDAVEPVLKAEEYRYVENASEVGQLRIESGRLLFGAPEDLANAAALDVPKGLMRVQIFCLLKGRSSKIVLVACRSDAPPPPLIRMQELEF